MASRSDEFRSPLVVVTVVEGPQMVAWNVRRTETVADEYEPNQGVRAHLWAQLLAQEPSAVAGGQHHWTTRLTSDSAVMAQLEAESEQWAGRALGPALRGFLEEARR